MGISTSDAQEAGQESNGIPLREHLVTTAAAETYADAHTGKQDLSPY